MIDIVLDLLDGVIEYFQHRSEKKRLKKEAAKSGETNTEAESKK